MEKKELKTQIIMIDATFVDRLSADISAHFSQTLSRPVKTADLAEWLVCCALDAKMPKGEGPTQVIFVCDKGQKELKHFVPSDLKTQIDGKAFYDEQMGEFQLCAIYHEDLITGEPLFVQCVRSLLGGDEGSAPNLAHLALVPDMMRYGTELNEALVADTKKVTTLLTMNPQESTAHRHALVGFSLMHAMEIHPDEV